MLRAVSIPTQTLNPRKVPQVDDEPLTEESIVPANLTRFVSQASSPDLAVQLQALTQLHTFLVLANQPPIKPLITCGLLPALIRILKNQSAGRILQFEACRILTFVALRAIGDIKAVARAGAIPAMIQLLSSPHPIVSDAAVLFLSNIISFRRAGVELVKLVHSEAMKMIGPLLDLVRPEARPEYLRDTVRLIQQLSAKMEAPFPSPEIYKNMFPRMNFLLEHDDWQILEYTAGTINNMTFLGKDQVQVVIDKGVLPKLIPLLSHVSVLVKVAAFRVIRNVIGAGHWPHWQALFACSEFFSQLSSLIDDSDTEEVDERGQLSWARQDALFCLLHIWNSDQIQGMIDASQLIPFIIRKIEIKTLALLTPYARKYAVYILYILAIRATMEQIKFVISWGIIPAFCNILDPYSNHPSLNLYPLLGLRRFLKVLATLSPVERMPISTKIDEIKGLENIRGFLTHADVELCKIATDIIEERGELEADITTAIKAFQY